MQCYMCAKAGKQTEAVGICIVCGMGLCMEHAIRDDVVLTATGQNVWAHTQEPIRLPRILCLECKQALEQPGQ